MKTKTLAVAAAVALIPFTANASGQHDGAGHDHSAMHDQISDQPWEFYGALYLALQYNDPGKVVDHDGNQPEANTWLNSEGTTIGFRGTLPLHHYFKAIWQFESLVNIDQFGEPPTGGHSHGEEPSSYNDSELAGGHNSFLGLAGDWGTFLGGKHNTPYFDASMQFDLFHHLAGDLRSMMGRLPGVSSGSGDHHGGLFNVSASNTLMYKTPAMGGLTVEAAYFGLNETRVKVEEKPSAYGLNARYGRGTFSLVGAYQVHNNFDTYDAVANESIDKTEGLMAGGMIDLFEGKTMVGAFYEQLKTTDELGTIPTDKRSGYYLNFRQKLPGGNAVQLAYGQVDEFVVNDGGAFLAVGLFHNLGEMAQVYAVYVGTDNETNSAYSTGAIGPLDNGGDPSTIAAGLIYNF